MSLRPVIVPLVVALALAPMVSGCGSDPEETMPDVVGLQLDVAQSDIERAGFDGEVEVIGGGIFGVIDESNWQICEQLPTAGDPFGETPRLSVDRSCEPEVEPSESPTVAPEPEVTAEPELPDETDTAEAYTYSGPSYDIVVADDNIGPAKLTQHWVYTDEIDPSDKDYRDQVKQIITDVAIQEGTPELIVEVVTDEEIALAEAASTMEAFIDEYGEEYFLETIPKKEIKGWVASYVGGVNPNTGQASSKDEAFEIIWMGYSNNPDIENWQPDLES